jgi:hypothetical protein
MVKLEASAMDPPLTAAELRDLRTERSLQEEADLVAWYTASIRIHVKEQARYTNSRSAYFWLVRNDIARVVLKHVTGQPFRWHHKHILTKGLDAIHLKRPIPYELIDSVWRSVRAQFPDCGMEIKTSVIEVRGKQQDFLVIDWNERGASV